MKNLIICIFFVFCMVSTSFADDISLTADVWEPYTMDPKIGKDGYLIDLARAAFSLKGHNIIYKLRPYSRSFLEVKDGTSDGLVGIYRKDAIAAGFIVPNNELGISNNSFFVRNDDTWMYNSDIKYKSLDGKSIGVIQNYVFSEIQDYLQANKSTHSVQYVTGEDPLRQNLMKLLAKRIDITVDDEISVYYTAKKMGIDDKIKQAGNLPEKNHIVIGFSPKNNKSSEYAQIISEGIEALRKSGELNKILGRYGLTDWKKH